MPAVYVLYGDEKDIQRTNAYHMVTYHFETYAEKEAFIYGISEATGWDKVYVANSYFEVMGEVNRILQKPEEGEKP